MSRKPITSSLAVLFPHAATTGAVTVRVAVSYLAEQSDASAGRWFWSYHIRVENAGPKAVQLLSRWWQIADGRGAVHEVVGDGVVGEMPMIAPGASYDYVSGCPLQTATGSMEGSFGMVDEQGVAFDAVIPRFALTGPKA
jgi:ApaG protein